MDQQPIRLPLGKYFLIWQIGASLILFFLNLVIYGTAGEPSFLGLIGVYAIYFGSFLSASLLIFIPPLIYRLVLKIRGKPYSRKSELNWFLLGVVLMILSIKSTIGQL